MIALLAALAAGCALALACAPARSPTIRTAAAEEPAEPDGRGWMMRWRPLWCLLAGIGALLFVGGAAGPVVAAAAAAGCWIAIGRAEPPELRRRREEVRRDLPALVRLFGSALSAGASPPEALLVVTEALPGAAADRLGPLAARLALGADPVGTWRSTGEDPALAPLGRAMARAYATGAPVVAAMERLGDELGRRARADVEDRARAVGVRAAVPLGLCLLPAFVLIGIVPVVGGLLSTLGL